MSRPRWKPRPVKLEPGTHDLYDPRYLAGVQRFNAGEYFDAHEVWEDLWHECAAADRRFYQSLIQAAVALYHWGNGNRAGAARLFASGRRYMEPYRPRYRGLDVGDFWRAMEQTLAGVVENQPTPRCPRIELDPPPDAWPEVPANAEGVPHE